MQHGLKILILFLHYFTSTVHTFIQQVKFNPGRADNMIIQSIALLDQMDKDINTFAMRVREWYSWHFPELKDIVKDNFLFAKCASYIKVTLQLTALRFCDLMYRISKFLLILQQYFFKFHTFYIFLSHFLIIISSFPG